jgi:hypothetical protein
MDAPESAWYQSSSVIAYTACAKRAPQFLQWTHQSSDANAIQTQQTKTTKISVSWGKWTHHSSDANAVQTQQTEATKISVN